MADPGPRHRQLLTPEQAVAQWAASGQPEYRTSVVREAFPLLMEAVAEGLPPGAQASVGLTHEDGCPCATNPMLPQPSCRCEILGVRLRVE